MSMAAGSYFPAPPAVTTFRAGGFSRSLTVHLILDQNPAGASATLELRRSVTGEVPVPDLACATTPYSVASPLFGIEVTFDAVVLDVESWPPGEYYARFTVTLPDLSVASIPLDQSCLVRIW